MLRLIAEDSAIEDFDARFAAVLSCVPVPCLQRLEWLAVPQCVHPLTRHYSSNETSNFPVRFPKWARRAFDNAACRV